MEILNRLFATFRSTPSPNYAALEKARPLFLIGPPRSGTTMLTRILNSHPQVLLTNETAVLLQLAENIANSRLGRKAGMTYGKNGGEQWANILSIATPQLVAQFYAELAAAQDKQALVYWGEKHPHFNRCLDFLVEQYPEATYVYAVRDPRDSACSIADMNDKGFDAASRLWKKISDTYEGFIANSPPDRKIVVVNYERMVSDYDSQAEKLFDELGVGYDAAARDYVREYANVDAHTSSSFVFKGAAKMKKASRSHDYASKSVGRWKRDLDSANQRLAAERFGEFLAKYGYPIN